MLINNIFVSKMYEGMKYEEINGAFKYYCNYSIYWDPVCIGTPFVLEKIIILTIILIGTY